MGRFAKQAPPLGAIPRCSSDLPIFVLHLGTPYGISSADKESRLHRVLPTENLPYRVYLSGILREMPPARSSPDVHRATWSTHVTAVPAPVFRYGCESSSDLSRFRFYHTFTRTLVTRPRMYSMFPWGKAVENSASDGPL